MMPHITGKDMGIKDRDDWVYADIPNMTKEIFDKYVEILGSDNIHWITMAERQWPDGTTTYRGQHLISPEGMARGKAHAERAKDV